MNNAPKIAALILAIIGLLNFGYAGYRHFEGYDGSSLPLIIAGVICFTLAAVLASRSGRTPN